MVSEVATYQPPAASPSALALWVADARGVQAVAEHIANSTFVPQGLRGKPVEVMVAMLAGQELGMQPMATLRSIDVIQGTPSLRAHAMRGLVQSHGHDLEVVESDAKHCIMRGRRKGSQTWQTVEWTIDRAKQLGLTGKDQWVKQPQTMLVARATGELCRLIAADVLYAMPYASEERDDEPVRATATVTAAQLVAPADRPLTRPEMQQLSDADLPDEPLPPRMISGPQTRKLHALFREAGLDRTSALAFCTDVLEGSNRGEVASTKDLTVYEAGEIIAALEAHIAEQNAKPPQPDPWAAPIDGEQPELEP